MSLVKLSPPRLFVPEYIVKNGLLAQYPFVEDLSSLILTDISGNGNHGTFGTGNNKPTLLREGVSFTFDDYVTLPTSIRNIISVYKNYTVDIVASVLSAGGILSVTDASNSRIQLSKIGSIVRAAHFNGSVIFGRASSILDLNIHYLSLSFNTTNTDMRLDNEKRAGQDGTFSSSATVGARIGSLTNGTNYMTMIMHYMLVYDRVLSLSEKQRNRRVIKNILKGRGVILP